MQIHQSSSPVTSILQTCPSISLFRCPALPSDSTPCCIAQDERLNHHGHRLGTLFRRPQEHTTVFHLSRRCTQPMWTKRDSVATRLACSACLAKAFPVRPTRLPNLGPFFLSRKHHVAKFRLDPSDRPQISCRMPSQPWYTSKSIRGLSSAYKTRSQGRLSRENQNNRPMAHKTAGM